MRLINLLNLFSLTAFLSFFFINIYTSITSPRQVFSAASIQNKLFRILVDFLKGKIVLLVNILIILRPGGSCYMKSKKTSSQMIGDDKLLLTFQLQYLWTGIINNVLIL